MSSARGLGRGGEGGFFLRTFSWLFGLVILAGTARLLTSGLHSGIGGAGGGIHLLVAWIGMFLPYASFAGGLSIPASVPRRLALRKPFLIAVLSFLFLGFLEPLARHTDRVKKGVDVSIQFPFGPETPAGLLALRSEIQRNQGSTRSYSVDHPLEWPWNWATYLLHSLYVLPLFSLFAGLLGQSARDLTTGLSPPNRRNVRWAIGLLSGIFFFFASAFGGDWVRADPLHSGMVGALCPLLVPLLELGIMSWLCRLRGARSARGEGSGLR